jgi:hypothetical protein
MTRPRRGPTRAWSAWYFLVPIATFGFFAFVPFVHAAVRLRRRRVWWFAAAYAAFTVVDLPLFESAPQDAAGTPTGPLSDITMIAAIAVAVLACVQLVPLRRAAYGLAEPPAPPDVEPAVATALRARQRRQKARELAGRDPLLARELHIGCPDVPHDYDDGGLVDLNAASAAVIAAACGLDADRAGQIVALRDGMGGLNNVDELFVHVDLPPGAWDRIRDHAIVLPK